MLDYVPMEIVAYADETTLPPLNEIYPEVIYGMPGGNYETQTPTGCTYEVKQTNKAAPTGLDVTTEYPECVNKDIVAVKLYAYYGEEQPDFQVAYYVQVNPNAIHYKLSSSDVGTMFEQGMENPFATPSDELSGNNFLVWMHNFGQTLTGENMIINLLNTEILGFSMIEIIFGSGFLIYVGWVFTKFIIGL